MDWVEITITTPPQIGEAKLVDTSTIPSYTAPNPQVRCNNKTVKARGLQYMPTKARPDEIEMELIDSAGTRNTYKFTITVK